MAALQFELQHSDPDTKARAGKINTDHGEILTPVFMPVGTVGSVKAVTQQQLKNDIHAQIILGNTYHLYMRPGLEVLEAAGGLHQFMNWQRPILTDSGGYQVFSLSGTSEFSYAQKSLELTNRWLDRCFERFNSTENKYGYSQNLFPIVQGGIHPELRKSSCEFVTSKDATGNAIGGLSVGEPTEKMYEICQLCCELLPQ